MGLGQEKISQDDVSYVLTKLHKWTNEKLEFVNQDGRVRLELPIGNDDDLNLKAIVIKTGFRTDKFGFSLLFNNCRIKGIDWKTKQRLNDGEIIYDCYHCNDWDDATQDSTRHSFDKDIDYQLRTLGDEDAIRYVLKMWNIKVPLKQTRFEGF